MENETQNSNTLNDSNLIITEEVRAYLATAGKWSFFLSIVGFIYIAFIIIAGIFMLALTPMMSQYQNPALPISMTTVGILYFVIGIVYIFPMYYTFRFGEKVKAAIQDNDQLELDESFRNLKRLFKFVGILTIITIALLVVLVPVAALVGYLYSGYAA